MISLVYFFEQIKAAYNINKQFSFYADWIIICGGTLPMQNEFGDTIVYR